MTGAGNARRTSWRTALVSVAVCGFIFLYYWTLLSDGKFFRLAPVRFDLVFNSMIEYMARGRFDVDPKVILQEGFTRDGRTYAYFGVFPALLRWPILLWPRFRGVDFTAIFCAIAATIAAMAQLGAVLRAGRAMADAAYKRRALVLAMATVVFGGSQVQFLRPSMYQESVYWAAAIAAVFVWLVFRWCIDVGGRRPAHVVAMAVLAGLCLLTRVSTAIGLYAACGAVLLPEAVAAVRMPKTDQPVFGLSRTILPASLILGSFAAICGYINNARWGSPLTFQDYRYYDILSINDPAYTALINYGYFNLARIPFSLSYFFLPVWAIIGSDGHLLFHAARDRLFYTVEAPPATFFASDLFLCFLCAFGCRRLARRGPNGIDRTTAWLIAVCLAIPGALMLTAIAVAFRYRMEFYPLFEFLGLFGLLALPGKIARRPRLVSAACGVMVAVSVISAHAFLLTYKISPWDDSAAVEGIGWTAAYRRYFHIKYPELDRILQREL